MHHPKGESGHLAPEGLGKAAHPIQDDIETQHPESSPWTPTMGQVLQALWKARH